MNAEYFSLGHLPTEGFHPLTRNLSDLVEQDIDSAIRLIQKIDLETVRTTRSQLPTIEKMRKDIEQTLAQGRRVFLSGCGATGRLALTLEATWRKVHRGTGREMAVQALMAGGDFALVKSVENFEDFPEYGIRHLKDLGFGEGDLLIAITEGGETPYVIGTVLGALALSSASETGSNPWFVYCNPRDVLCKTVERSREIIQDPRVKSLCLPVGPMALSGSTRLQAATAQMLSVGIALFGNTFGSANSGDMLIDHFEREFQQLDLVSFLKPVIDWETKVYQNKGTVMYVTDTYPIAVLTDTTERSPTFSLTPFEKSAETKGPFSLCYLSIPSAKTALDSWKMILRRPPLGLEWGELGGRLGYDSILEFNFGKDAIEVRRKRVAPLAQQELHINEHESLQQIEIKTDQFHVNLKTTMISHPLLEQILIKVILNTLSLMVMGNLKRYEGNVMTWVRPSNGKLIDRTIRYLEFLIQKRKVKFDLNAEDAREKLAQMVFEEQATIKPDEAVILKILEKLS